MNRDLAEGDEEYRLNQRIFLKRAVDGLFSVCMAIRRVPTISYSVDSKLSQKIAESLSDRVDKEYTQNHRDFLSEGVDLLIFDRREDPITPLIYNWSYQSLVNEFLGIEANSVKIKGSSHLFARQTDDSLLDANWSRNYGEFTRALREEIQRVAQDNNKSGSKMENIQDIQAVLDKLPSQTKHEKAILKHNDVIRGIISAVENGDIFSVSRLQQDIITENNKTDQFNALATILTNKIVTNTDKIKLVMLYCLKYHDDLDRVSRLKRAVASQNLPEVFTADSGSDQESPRLRCSE
jgi:vacuolar protein sorting-associated protein 45